MGILSRQRHSLMRRFAVPAVAALLTAGCGSGTEDQLATDTCEVLWAFQSGDLTLTEVEAEFDAVVARAVEAGANIDAIEAQVQVQCWDALLEYAEAADIETGLDSG